MTSVRLHSTIILMSLFLASCYQGTSTRMAGGNVAETQKTPKMPYNATAASDVDNKGGLTGQRQSR